MPLFAVHWRHIQRKMQVEKLDKYFGPVKISEADLQFLIALAIERKRSTAHIVRFAIKRFKKEVEAGKWKGKDFI